MYLLGPKARFSIKKSLNGSIAMVKKQTYFIFITLTTKCCMISQQVPIKKTLCHGSMAD